MGETGYGMDNVPEGIKLTSVNSATYYGRTGTTLNVSFSISIGEPHDVARADAEFMSETITSMVSAFVADYAEDGQEVD